MIDYGLKLKWQGNKEKYNAKAVAGALDVLGNKGSSDGKKKLTKFYADESAVSVGTYLAVRFISKTWPWLKAQVELKDDKLQVSVTDDKEAEFKKLLETGDLERKIRNEIERPKKAFQDDLEEKDTTAIDQLAKRLEKIKLQSVQKCSRKQRDVIGTLVEGEFEEETDDHVNIVADAGGQGNAIGIIVGKGAKAKLKHRGGVEIIGGDPDVAKYAIEMAAGNKVEVAVKFSDRSERFVRKYKPDQTIYDVIADIIKETRKKIKHIENTKTKEIEDDDTAISTVRDNGHLKSLMAVIE